MSGPVGPHPKTIEACLEKMRNVRKGTLSKRSIDGYCEDALRSCKKLRDNGYKYWPWEIGINEINWLLEEYQKEGKKIETRRRYIAAIRAFTEFYGNYTIKELKIRWPHDDRDDIQWLTRE